MSTEPNNTSGPFRKLEEFIQANYYQPIITFTNSEPSQDGNTITYEVRFTTPSTKAIQQNENQEPEAT